MPDPSISKLVDCASPNPSAWAERTTFQECQIEKLPPAARRFADEYAQFGSRSQTRTSAAQRRHYSSRGAQIDAEIDGKVDGKYSTADAGKPVATLLSHPSAETQALAPTTATLSPRVACGSPADALLTHSAAGDDQNDCLLKQTDSIQISQSEKTAKTKGSANPSLYLDDDGSYPVLCLRHMDALRQGRWVAAIVYGARALEAGRQYEGCEELNESIETNLRSLDQKCASSRSILQLITTAHLTGRQRNRAAATQQGERGRRDRGEREVRGSYELEELRRLLALVKPPPLTQELWKKLCTERDVYERSQLNLQGGGSTFGETEAFKAPNRTAELRFGTVLCESHQQAEDLLANKECFGVARFELLGLLAWIRRCLLVLLKDVGEDSGFINALAARHDGWGRIANPERLSTFVIPPQICMAEASYRKQLSTYRQIEPLGGSGTSQTLQSGQGSVGKPSGLTRKANRSNFLLDPCSLLYNDQVLATDASSGRRWGLISRALNHSTLAYNSDASALWRSSVNDFEKAHFSFDEVYLAGNAQKAVHFAICLHRLVLQSESLDSKYTSADVNFAIFQSLISKERLLSLLDSALASHLVSLSQTDIFQGCVLLPLDKARELADRWPFALHLKVSIESDAGDEPFALAVIKAVLYDHPDSVLRLLLKRTSSDIREYPSAYEFLIRSTGDPKAAEGEVEEEKSSVDDNAFDQMLELSMIGKTNTRFVPQHLPSFMMLKDIYPDAAHGRTSIPVTADAEEIERTMDWRSILTRRQNKATVRTNKTEANVSDAPMSMFGIQGEM